MFLKGMDQEFFSRVTHGRRQNAWAQIGGFKNLEGEGLNQVLVLSAISAILTPEKVFPKTLRSKSG